MSIIGHRLTSLAVIPTSHQWYCAAITLTTLQYKLLSITKAMYVKHADGPQTDKILKVRLQHTFPKLLYLTTLIKLVQAVHTVSTDKR